MKLLSFFSIFSAVERRMGTSVEVESWKTRRSCLAASWEKIVVGAERAVKLSR